MTPPDIAPIQILLVEDSPADVALTTEALRDARIANDLHVVGDGEAALAFLRGAGKYAAAPRPDLVLLDLNLPRKDGREVLGEVKWDDDLCRIPIVVMSTSTAEVDIVESYDLHANCYVSKPVDFGHFLDVVRSIEGFWLSIVRLPKDDE